MKNEFSQNQIFYDTLKSKIACLDRKPTVDSEKYPETQVTQENVQINLLKNQSINERNKVLLSTTMNKEQYLKNIFNLGIYYDSKLTDMICSFYLSHFKNENTSTIHKKREEFLKNNEEDVKCLEDNHDWSPDDCK